MGTGDLSLPGRQFPPRFNLSFLKYEIIKSGKAESAIFVGGGGG